jgi:HlyD family secretion protein
MPSIRKGRKQLLSTIPQRWCQKTFPLSIAILLVACSSEKPASLPGYIEGDFTRIASPIGGRLLSLNVSKGQDVSAGALLFTLDQEEEHAAVAQAQATVAQQEASAADLEKGRRREELAVLEAQSQQLALQRKLSAAELLRQQTLARQGFLSPSSLDAATTRLQTDDAKLAEASANLAVAKLAARSDTQRAAQASILAARAALSQSTWRQNQKQIQASVAARVDDTLYRVGEWVPAGAPVVSLLAPGAIKIRFFAQQSLLSTFPLGRSIQVRCDGCGEPFEARISYIAKSPEFTPPVIYSKENRARLVFLIEAQPASAQKLTPGQPVDVMLGPKQ